MTLCAYNDVLDGACGVNHLYGFLDQKGVRDFWWYQNGEPLSKIKGGGSGWLTAGFIEDNELSDRMFEALCKKHTLAFRTPTRMNRNSGNKFYFAIFDTRKPRKKKEKNEA